MRHINVDLRTTFLATEQKYKIVINIMPTLSNVGSCKFSFHTLINTSLALWTLLVSAIAKRRFLICPRSFVIITPFLSLVAFNQKHPITVNAYMLCLSLLKSVSTVMLWRGECRTTYSCLGVGFKGQT